MIIDQLPLLDGNPQDADEMPIERGVATYKAKLTQLAASILAKLVKDSAPTEGSTNPVESGGVYSENQRIEAAKQDKITAAGVLKADGSGNVTTAVKGTDYGATFGSFTLPAAGWVIETGWSEYAQVVNDAMFKTGYLCIVSPSVASKTNFAGVYADDISTDGIMTFHSPTAKTADIDVFVMRFASDGSKTVTVGG